MEPGALIASGLDGDIFEFGAGLVLRKTRDGRSIEHEARIMRYAAEYGYPVPAVHEVRAQGSEIVMQRIDGPLMMAPMAKRPWTIPRYASLLADLHDQLHQIPAPDWLSQLPDGGDRLVHLDLHPLNVLLSPRGPVVIDWSNASRGEGLTDVALTYVLLTCPRLPGPRALQIAAQPARIGLARLFTRRYRGKDLDERIAVAARLKTLDRNMSADEIANMHRLAHRMRQKQRRR
jgi:aminoglycoside phosphotransferase (APT) family kinase protein